MEQLGISIWAVLVSTLACFFIGFLWYTPLFGKAWAKENGFDTSGKVEGGAIAKGMIMNLIGNFLLAYVLAHNIAAWSFVPGIEEFGMWGGIINSAIFTWLGFYVPVDLNTVAWERKSWKLFFINSGYHLVNVFVASVILTMMRP
jgi:hypothetical protein